MRKKVYLAGDGLRKGNQLLRAQERDAIRSLGNVELHYVWDDKEINDKTKNPTAEQIQANDFAAMLKSDIIVADVANDSVGTITEMGEMNGVNYMLKRLDEIVYLAANHASDSAEEDFLIAHGVRELLKEIPVKEVYWQTTDIRDGATEPESGFRRSLSYNQYLIGTMLMLSGREPMQFEDILEELKKC